jgi:hypothetical protein
MGLYTPCDKFCKGCQFLRSALILPYVRSDPEGSPQEKEKPSLAAKLSLLKMLVERTESACWAVSFEEILDLLLNVGLILQDISEKTDLGTAVGEDPRGGPDALGNVKMFHRRVYRGNEEELLHSIGTKLLDLCHEAYIHRDRSDRHKSSFDYILDDLKLDQWDDVGTEEFLAAKRRCGQLRRDNIRLDRRNESLWIQLQKEKKALEDLASKFPEGRQFLPKWALKTRMGFGVAYHDSEIVTHPKPRFVKTTNTASGPDIRSGEKGMHSQRPRKSKEAQNADSQTNGLSW